MVRTATTRAERRAAALRTRDRLAAGARSRFDELRGGARGTAGGGAGSPAAAPVNRARPRGAAQTRAWLAEQAQVRTTAWARRQWLDDLDVLLDTEGTTPRMYLTSVAVDGVGKNLERAAAVREHLTSGDEARARRAAAQRHR